MEHIEKIKAIKWNKGNYKTTDEISVIDEYTYLYIDSLPVRKFSTYPENLDDFSIGYCLGEGLIKDYNDIENISIKETHIIVKTKHNHTIEEDYDQDSVVQEKKGGCQHACACRLLEYQGVQSDSAGGWRSELDKIEPIKSNLKIDATTIIKDMERLTENAFVWQATGGVHVAQLIFEDNIIIREDVSRHVAVDKVIGAASKKGYNLNKSYISYSGRMPADMLIKLVRVGIPIIISNAAPAISGYKIAETGGITMIGFVRGERFNLYTHPERINLSK